MTATRRRRHALWLVPALGVAGLAALVASDGDALREARAPEVSRSLGEVAVTDPRPATAPTGGDPPSGQGEAAVSDAPDGPSASAAQPTTDGQRTVEGEVVDAATGNGIPGAQLFFDPNIGMIVIAPVRTDAAGRFQASVPEQCSVRVEAAGFGARGLMFLPQGRIRFELLPALTLEGRVVDPTGRPLPAAVMVQAYLPDPTLGAAWAGPWEANAVADDDGRFSVPVPPGGRWERSVGPHAATVGVWVEHPGHLGATLEDVVVPRAGPLTVVLGRALPLRGRVVAADGSPAARVDVVAVDLDSRTTSTSTTADAAGRFSFAEAPERVLLKVRGGLPPPPGDGPVPDRPRPVVGAFEVRLPLPDEVELRLPDVSAWIEGCVVLPDGGPAPGAKLVARAVAPGRLDATLGLPGVRSAGMRSIETQAAADGSFRVGPFEPGAWIELHSAEPPPAPLVRAAAGARGVVLVLAEEPARGEVLMQGARGDRWTVVAHDASGHAAAPARGPSEAPWWFTLPAGRHAIVARRPGSRPDVHWVEVLPDSELHLPPPRHVPGGGALRLRVRWPEGPASPLRVRVAEAGTGLSFEQVVFPPAVPDHPALIEGLAAGRVTVRVSTAGREVLVAEAFVGDDEATEVTVEAR
ncbi:MAG: carboxypeptidase regulatory-like domain-containing protein [Planctomycetes bacterium]|nr:carboxypeptidase regulatory-like domain-containing protein [Planctomycetota bacterium]